MTITVNLDQGAVNDGKHFGLNNDKLIELANLAAQNVQNSEPANNFIAAFKSAATPAIFAEVVKGLHQTLSDGFFTWGHITVQLIDQRQGITFSVHIYVVVLEMSGNQQGGYWVEIQNVTTAVFGEEKIFDCEGSIATFK